MKGREELGERLSAYLDGEVTAEERAALADLVARDPAARDLLEELRRAQAEVAGLPTAAAPPDVLASITARLERQALFGPEDEQAALVRTRPRPWRAWGAVAALVAVAVTAAIYVAAPRPGARRVAIHDESRADKSLEGTTPGRDEDGSRAQLRELGEALDRAIFPKGEKESAVATLPAASTRTPAPADDEKKARQTELLSDLTAVRPGASGDVTRGLPSSAPAAPSDWRTLEQKLSEGADLAAVTEHRFENEPLQMRVAFAAPTQQARFERELRAVLAHYQVVPMLGVGGSATAASTFAETASSPAGASNALVYYEGKALDNFAAAVPGQGQLLVRLPPEALPDVVAVATSNSAQLDLEVGGLQARGAIASNSLALQTIGQFPSPALDALSKSEELGAPEADEAARETATDLMRLLTQLGFPVGAADVLAPESPGEPGVAQDAPVVASAEPAPRAAAPTRAAVRPRGGAYDEDGVRDQAGPGPVGFDDFVGPPAPPPPVLAEAGTAGGSAPSGGVDGAPLAAAEAPATGSPAAPTTPRGPLSGGRYRGGAPPAFAGQGAARGGRGGYGVEPAEPLTLVIDMRPVGGPPPDASTAGASPSP